MAEGLISLNTDTKLLSVKDYEKAYDSGYLSYEKYLNTGLLSIVNSQTFEDSNWYLTNIKKLELPNVIAINGPLFGTYSPYNLEEIIAPRLKTINADNLSKRLYNFRKLYLEDIEYIDGTITNYNSHIFDYIEYLSYSRLISIYGNPFIWSNMTNLEKIYLPNLETISNVFTYAFADNAKVSHINLPKLKNVPELGFVNLTNLQYLLLSSIEIFPSLNNIPLLKSIELNAIISNTSSMFSKRDTFLWSGNFSNLSNISLPNIQTLYACGLGFSRLTSSLVTLMAPNLVQLTFGANFGNIKSITLPALTAFSSYNMLSQSYNDYFVQFETINMPNVSIVYSNSLLINNSGIRDYSVYHTINLNMNKCEEICEQAFNPMGLSEYWDERERAYGITINTPKLQTIGSSAFMFCYNLDEINLAHVSVLNNDVFLGAGGHHIQKDGITTWYTLKLKNIQNIKEIKRGAIAFTFLNTNYLSFPNCEIFDFDQVGRSYNEITFGYGIHVLCPSIHDAYNKYVNEFNMPKLSSIIFDYTSMINSFYGTCPYFYMSHFCSSKFKADACSQIKIIDGDHGGPLAGYFDYYDSQGASSYIVRDYASSIKLFCTELLYIPNCETFEHIRNENLYTNFPSTLNSYIEIMCGQLYAAKLSNLSNFILGNCYSLSTLDNANVLNTVKKLTYYTGSDYTKIKYISFPYSFSTPIDLIAANSQAGYITSLISLPNYYGKINTISYKYTSSRYFYPVINGDVYIGNAQELNIFCLSGNITLNNSIINIGSDIKLRATSCSIYFPECSTINEYYLSTSVPIQYCELYASKCDLYNVYDYLKTITIGSDYSFGFTLNKTFSSTSVINMPNLKNINYYIENDIVVDSSATYHSQLLLNLNYSSTIKNVYMPELETFSIIFTNPEIISNYYETIYNRMILVNPEKVTLGFSDPLSFKITQSTDLRYLSLSKLAYINKGTTNTYRRYISEHTINVGHTNFDEINLDSISYIEEFGLALPYYSKSLNFPELKSLLSFAVRLPLMKDITFPKLEYLGGDNLWECSLITYLELPSTCSSIGHNAIPENFSILKLNYSGVVSMPDISVEYTEWDFWASRYLYHLCYPFSGVTRIVQVPTSLVSAYRSDSTWGGYLASYNWFITGF